MFKDKTAKKRVYNNKEISTLDAMHNKIINLYSNKIIEEKNNLNKIKDLELDIDGPEKFVKEFGIIAEKVDKLKIVKKNLPIDEIKLVIFES